MTQPAEGNFIPVTLAFRDLWYSVPDPTHPKPTIDLLNGVSGFALPGTITALMGSSGAGKTTLMDVIAGRKTGGEIRGDIMLNGHPATDLAIRRATGYCEQMDIHSDASTFREALTFSAFLRQGADIPDSQKYDFVNECLKLLDLHPIADQIIRGSSTEQMKRLTIGVELAAQPSVLFLDEPTSGLDARSAKLIMDGVRKVADTGRTIVYTIHQPSAMVFEVFDSLLLLKRGGEMVFFGDLGEKAVNLIKYFESIDGVAKLEKDYNPATWMLEVIGAGVGNENGSKTDFVSRVKSSEQYRQLESNLDREGVTRPSPSLPPLEFKRKRAASNWVQATFLTKRWFNLYWRTPSFNLTRIVVSMVLAISLGVSYLDTEYVSYQGVNSGMGMVYMAAVNMTIITFNSSLPITCKEQTAFYRERASESYNAFWYFVGATLVEIPYCFGTTLLFMAIFYPMTDFTGVPAFFTFWLSLSLIVLLMSYFGQFLAFLLPSLEVASVFMVIVNIVCTLFTGFNPPAIAIPSGYKWIYLIVPNKRTSTSQAWLKSGDTPEEVFNILLLQETKIKPFKLEDNSRFLPWFKYTEMYHRTSAEGDLQTYNFLRSRYATSEFELAPLFQSLKQMPGMDALGENLQSFLFLSWMKKGFKPKFVQSQLSLPLQTTIFELPKDHVLYRALEEYTIFYTASRGGEQVLKTVRGLFADNKPYEALTTAMKV
ncbi:pleiotropic drug resistance protein ABC superfamily [Phytophthora cinnamomi]|uniref:pleiotropic drug resistance protein ABC superfamily n=1 Tax=Phytophthora cinnamomi TaxID=4785 RepID=UPI0035595762|nr:pleiotropic drug resistance protein ABC superfamily [Phytophthora cinnamomi]